MSLRITQYGESILHVKGECVVKFDNDLNELGITNFEHRNQILNAIKAKFESE